MGEPKQKNSYCGDLIMSRFSWITALDTTKFLQQNFSTYLRVFILTAEAVNKYEWVDCSTTTTRMGKCW